MINEIVKSLRVRQWAKNLIVFAPVVFSGKLGDPLLLLRAMTAFSYFCLASSSAYLINDVVDMRVDRFHPLKKKRPLACGRFDIKSAVVVSLILMLFTVSFAFLYKISLGWIIVSYLLLNLAYSGLLKRIVILDVMSLSIGFVLRAWAGAVVIGVLPSHWLQLSLFFLALFLSLTKRRQELVILQHESALKHRGVLSNYNSSFIDQLSAILTTAALLCYALYSVSGEVTGRLGQFGFVYTVPFVVYGIFRYLYLVHVKYGALDPTEALFSDLPLLLSVIAWVASVILTLYR